MIKETTLIIGPSDRNMHSNSLDVDFYAKEISIKRGRIEKSYYDITNLTNITNLRVIKLI